MSGVRGRLLVRLARELLYLRARRCMPEVEVMAAEMGVCVRTLYRDLAALEEAGWPLPMRRSDDREAA
jgi:predicted DNA-binding transcriptional regulator YafY